MYFLGTFSRWASEIGQTSFWMSKGGKENPSFSYCYTGEVTDKIIFMKSVLWTVIVSVAVCSQTYLTVKYVKEMSFLSPEFQQSRHATKMERAGQQSHWT